jgi:hypothetical protein
VASLRLQVTPDTIELLRVSSGLTRLRGAAAHEQRARLKLERVEFNGKRVDMDRFEHSFKPWEVYGDEEHDSSI